MIRAGRSLPRRALKGNRVKEEEKEEEGVEVTMTRMMTAMMTTVMKMRWKSLSDR